MKRNILIFSLLCIFSIDASPVKVAGSLSADLENWMTNLPTVLRQTSITQIAIPGSHDSFTSEMTTNSELAPDAEQILVELAPILGGLLKQVMLNWSKTQSFLAKEQLLRGIRYFDIRVSTRNNSDDLWIVHGLYSTTVSPILNEINEYLDAHPKEVVVLDFQHFYAFSNEIHTKQIEMIKTAFGSKLLPYTSDMSSITLDTMSDNGYQVIVIYREESVLSANPELWPTTSFPNPWADTTDSNELIDGLNAGLKSRDKSVAYISQLVLTPDAQFILSNVLSTLLKKCAEEFEETRLNWILAQTPGDGGFNIVIADFIELSDNKYSQDVIDLNEKLIAQTSWNWRLF